jgi:hypothetical protein
MKYGARRLGSDRSKARIFNSPVFHGDHSFIDSSLLVWNSQMNEEQRDKKMALIQNQVKILLSSFDAVQIFATKYESDDGEGKTSHYVYGDGNWYARYGLIRDWVTIEESKRGNIEGEE